MTIFIVILTVTIVILALLAYRKKRQLEAMAQQCAKGVQEFHEKLQKLTDPSHFFTDEEVVQFKEEYAPLLKNVQKLFDSMFISNEYLNGLGLKDFIDERRVVNHLQYKNNQLYKSAHQQNTSE
ncbi:MAG: hypothetical protein IKX33_07635 [Prevotella sp.]|nr:hypothetical protein [Prevotella sp.]